LRALTIFGRAPYGVLQKEHRVLRRSIFAVKLSQADGWPRLDKAAGIRVE
jgi:hypothetical protein